MNDISSETQELLVINVLEARVLGCLVEKEATVPDVYPLTVNSALSAVNQKTSRDPVMSATQGDVHHTLRQLEQKGLTRQVFSSRAERYEHCLNKVLDLSQQQVALVSLLMLRGPQTLNELLTRSERLSKFADADDVRHHLERLMSRMPAIVVQIPRGAGQREDRYMHLLCGAVDVDAISASFRASPVIQVTGPISELEDRIKVLEDAVAKLQEQVGLLQGG